jgi:hypothetical protein
MFVGHLPAVLRDGGRDGETDPEREPLADCWAMRKTRVPSRKTM